MCIRDRSYEQNFPAIIESLDLAIKLAQRKKVSGIVTLPILKKTLTINGTHYPGHTEYLGKKSNKNLSIALCGEHGGDPKSIFYCKMLGLNYVSCSPFRVPIARLAAAQADIMGGSLKEKN